MLPEYALIYLRSWLQFSDYFCSFQVTELLLINLVYGSRSTTKILDLQDGFCHQTPTYLWFLISTLRHSIKLWLESLIVSKMNFNLGMPSKKICPEGDIGTFSIFFWRHSLPSMYCTNGSFVIQQDQKSIDATFWQLDSLYGRNGIIDG